MKLVRCQPLEPQALSAVAQLDQRCFGGLWSLEAYKRELTSPNSDLLMLVTGHPEPMLKSQGAASEVSLIGVGCCWAIVDEAHITLLGISPEFQSRGLGQWLLLQLLKAARDRNLQRATLEVRASNTTARKLYQKFGFQVAGRRPHYYDNGEDALILWLGGLCDPSLTATFNRWHQQSRERLMKHGWQPSSSNHSVTSLAPNAISSL